jgi:hypothetical protein
LVYFKNAIGHSGQKRMEVVVSGRILSAILFTALILVLLSCSSGKVNSQLPDNVYSQGRLILEAEDFRLLDAEIISDPLASNGKAVTITSPRAFCSIEFNLPPGTYVAGAVVKAPDADHDEIFLSIENHTILVKPVVYNQYSCPEFLQFTIDRPGKNFIQFAAFSSASGKPLGETGVIIDYVQILECDYSGSATKTPRHEDY